MEATILKTDMHCNKCISKVEPFLKSDASINKYSFDLASPNKTITIEAEELDVQKIIFQLESEGYKAEEPDHSKTFTFEGIPTKTKSL